MVEVEGWRSVGCGLGAQTFSQLEIAAVATERLVVHIVVEASWLLKVQFLADDVCFLVVGHCGRERRTASSRPERAGCACQAVLVVVAVVMGHSAADGLASAIFRLDLCCV